MGTAVPRVDAAEKAAGQAVFASDFHPPGTLFAKLLTSKHAAAVIKKLSVEGVTKVKGVLGVRVLKGEGSSTAYEGEPLVAVAAERPELAEDGLRAIDIQYEVKEHFVDETSPAEAEKQGRSHVAPVTTQGDVTAALASSRFRHSGRYAVPSTAHACLEPHGCWCHWEGDQLQVRASTQNVSGLAAQFAARLKIEASSIRVEGEYVGGGFGSKTTVNDWDIACAGLAQETGRPVRLLLDSPTELRAGGTRESALATVTVGCDAQGRLTAWESNLVTMVPTGGTVEPARLPALFTIPHQRQTVTTIGCDVGPLRPFRAGQLPQATYITLAAIDDLAHVAGLDPLEFLRRNLDDTPLGRRHREELDRAAALSEWSKRWHPRGEAKGKGAVRRGLGVALHAWSSTPTAAECRLLVHPEGTVELFAGTQETGTGTKTILAMTAAEILGLPVDRIRVRIGSNQWPATSASRGATTAGAVTFAVRDAASQARRAVQELVARKFAVDADAITIDQQVFSAAGRRLADWSEATALLGDTILSVTGTYVPPQTPGEPDPVGGAQVAEVEVDIDTGRVKVVKLVAVQDLGLVVNRQLARSQVISGLTMGISAALFEERIVDVKTGRMLNADIENYRMARLGDIGELVVELVETEAEYQRGVRGVSAAPLLSPMAAIANAVTNAIGVRVASLPMTPPRILAALKGARG